MGANVGRHVFGSAAFAFGLITFVWHEYNGWHLPRDVWSAPGGLVVMYAVAVAFVCGGIAVQFRTTAKAGAAALLIVYLLFAFICVFRIAASPRVYDVWGNFFEQFSLMLGAAFAYASVSPRRKPYTANLIGSILFGLCAVSFAVEQAIHLDVTASLVPKWLPPNQMFWTIATTAGFALAAIALLINRAALLAIRLLTAMLVIFGVSVWVPSLISDVRSHGNWGEATETFAIAGAARMLADLLANE